MAIKVGMMVSSVSRRSGGLFEAVRGLGVGLQDVGCEVQIFGAREAAEREGDGWGSLHVQSFPAFGAVRYSPGLAEAVRSSDLDVLHVHGLWTYMSLAGLRWSRSGRGPRLVAPHGMLDSWALQQSYWKKTIARYLYEDASLKEASCLHAVCEAEVAAMRSMGLRNPVCVVPNGVELPSERGSANPSWSASLQAGTKVLLYLGRLHPKKNLMNLLRAWESIATKATAPEWCLVIAGWATDDYEMKLRALANELGLARRVLFVGPQFDVEKAASFRRATAFILPSLSEGLPVAALEALSYGVPALVSPQCNLPKRLLAGAALQIGVDVWALIEGLRSMTSMTDEELQAIGTRGREFVTREFSWAHTSREMRAVYDWLMGSGPKPTCVAE